MIKIIADVQSSDGIHGDGGDNLYESGPKKKRLYWRAACTVLQAVTAMDRFTITIYRMHREKSTVGSQATLPMNIKLFTMLNITPKLDNTSKYVRHIARNQRKSIACGPHFVLCVCVCVFWLTCSCSSALRLFGNWLRSMRARARPSVGHYRNNSCSASPSASHRNAKL